MANLSLYKAGSSGNQQDQYKGNNSFHCLNFIEFMLVSAKLMIIKSREEDYENLL